MGVRNVAVFIGDRIPTSSDKLSSDCLTIELPSKISVVPGTVTQINLTVSNSSPIGRMSHLHASYDASQGIVVQIPDPKVYVGPESKTITYALIESKIGSKGQCNVMFGVT